MANAQQTISDEPSLKPSVGFIKPARANETKQKNLATNLATDDLSVSLEDRPKAPPLIPLKSSMARFVFFDLDKPKEPASRIKTTTSGSMVVSVRICSIVISTLLLSSEIAFSGRLGCGLLLT